MTLSDKSLLLSYLLFFSITLVLSILINSLFLKFSHTLGIRNKTGTIIRWSETSNPSFGGISFFIIFLFSLSAYSIVYEESLNFRNLQFIGFLLACILAFLMGLYDDAYNTKVSIKLGSQIACGLILIVTGTQIHFFESDILNYLLTLIWVVGMMNSINMLDNMDGVTTIVSGFIIVAALISINLQGDFSNPYYLVLLGVLASLVGFLFYNWNPSKMFMGDTGSQFLGVLLASVGIIYFWNPYGKPENLYFSRQIALILTVFALPIIDTTTVFIKRIRLGNSPFVGGKDHTTHHLSYLGLSDRQVGWVVLIISALCTLLGTSILFCCDAWTMLPALLYLGYFLILFAGLFYIANLNK